MSRRSLVIALLVAFSTSAWAGGKVDWSQYIDRNPSAPLRSSPAPSRSSPAKAKVAKRSKKKKKAPRRRTRARSKAKSRHR
jgi:hypothetical protein